MRTDQNRGMQDRDDGRRELVRQWRKRAEELEEYARRRRTEGDIHGPHGAEDAEQAANEYRQEADLLEQRHLLAEG